VATSPTSTASTTATTSSTQTTASTSTTTSSAATTGASTTGNVRQTFDAALRDNLRNQQHLSRAQTNCVIRRLDRTLSGAEIQQVAAGQFPRSLAKKAGRAGVRRAAAG
jgi:hypothetical protein